MQVTQNAIIGLIFFIGLGLLLHFTVISDGGGGIGDIVSGDKGEDPDLLKVVFDNVGGLSAGTKVQASGTEIGVVNDLTYIPETGKVEVTIERIQGFKEEVELTVEGLPDGISCPAVISAGEGDSAKTVKLKFSGSSPPLSGPLKIVGKAGERVRMAIYAIPKMTIRRDDPWLSVIEAGK